ncbi:uncharacterized protein JCM6883_002808 [Sporobolomyces salmoneus]|uniref:uncharacterized protein n=1 Tax=Sporobolomyces salmoneus TaxID=183962 RepID=UPI00317BFCB9
MGEPRLINLIPELLSQIFHEIHRDRKATTQAICRTLLPFQQAALYRNVSTWNERAATKLLTTLSGCPHLASLVRTVKIYNVVGWMLEEEVIVRVLRNLRIVQEISLTSFRGIPLVLFDPQLVKGYLSNLARLSVYRKGELPEGLLNSLQIYPSLTSLYFEFGDLPSWDGVHLPQIERLGLDGPDSEGGPWTLAAFSSDNFPSLRELELVIPPSSFVPFLSNLDSATQMRLRKLTLHALHAEDSYGGQARPCDQVLPSFSSLIDLDLGEDTFTDAIGRALGRLPLLETLRFGSGALLPIPRLKALHQQIPSLKNLILDQYEASESELLKASAMGGVEELGKAIEEIRRAGVKVEGTLLQAL